jgi:spore germination protein
VSHTGYKAPLELNQERKARLLKEKHDGRSTSAHPSAPQPDPGTISRTWLYFTETGHYLSYGFKDFWLRSGGLPVFGFPLTTEFDELNLDLGIYRTVQYTERQRFEYHPELAGTPYETLLGRLGAADAQRRGLLSHPAFQPLPAGTKSDAHSDFFPQTGHRVSHGFRSYWHGHGLDFGDPGISFRESLALFGYPISEEFVDPETGLVTQYFERAVFEYHPDNPDPYKILLRRLGAEEMSRRDW